MDKQVHGIGEIIYGLSYYITNIDHLKPVYNTMISNHSVI